jgi:hypothetical protein
MPVYPRPDDPRGNLVTYATEEDIAAARALGNRYDPDVQGRFPWDADSYGSPEPQKRLNLSKASLGTFFEGILRHGGGVTSVYAFGKYVRSAVVARVFLTVKAKEAFEAETGFKLRPPITVSVNSE